MLKIVIKLINKTTYKQDTLQMKETHYISRKNANGQAGHTRTRTHTILLVYNHKN